jgi:hypothetical protein
MSRFLALGYAGFRWCSLQLLSNFLFHFLIPVQVILYLWHDDILLLIPNVKGREGKACKSRLNSLVEGGFVDWEVHTLFMHKEVGDGDKMSGGSFWSRIAETRE